MDIRAEKLAKARKKLRDHQEKKVTSSQKEDLEGQQRTEILNENSSMTTITKLDQDQNNFTNGNKAEFFNNQDTAPKTSEIKSDVITEMLISNKTNLELQINDLSAKLAHMESLYGQEISNHNHCKQQNIAFQSEINNLMTKCSRVVQEASSKDRELQQLKITNQQLHDEKNNLFEQVELTKSMLTSKESENSQLLNQVSNYENQIDLLQLQIQQLTNDSAVKIDQSSRSTEETDALVLKIANLEQKIETLQKDKEQISSHYEHYVRDLNERLKFELDKNETLSKDLQNLYNREHSLIEQISEMEIRLQNYATKNESDRSKQMQVDTDLQNLYIAAKSELEEVNGKYNELQKQHMDCQKKINDLTQAKEIEAQDNNIYKHDNVDISKLHADIASDKLAAQRATEQNKKLKSDIEALEQVIVKMGKDKLELTEKWTHEKQLNQGLALKLAELEECAKNMQNQIKAKDDEMIRLLNEYREMERKYEIIVKDVNDTKENLDVDNIQHETIKTEKNHNDDTAHEETVLLPTTSQDINSKITDAQVKLDGICIKKEDAMVKLQERFLNIMDEVANLSDEKHRLEHIILQLQNETDTICEYVALYQQQRSLLKKREEERSNQLKIYQDECDKLKRHLEELRDLLLRFAADEELASFLKEETRYNDLTRVKELLEKLQNCSLINSKFNNLDLNIFYPCNCCSGQLITI